MATKSIDLGPVSAYAVAVANGFTGTEAEWEQYIANAAVSGSNAAAASQAAQAAQAAAEAALGQLTPAKVAAIGDIETAKDAAVSAVQGEGAAQVQAVRDAGAEQDAGLIAEGSEQVDRIALAAQDAAAAVSSAQSSAVAAVQAAQATGESALAAKTNEQLAQIPTVAAMADNVDGLNSAVAKLSGRSPDIVPNIMARGINGSNGRTVQVNYRLHSSGIAVNVGDIISFSDPAFVYNVYRYDYTQTYVGRVNATEWTDIGTLLADFDGIVIVELKRPDDSAFTKAEVQAIDAVGVYKKAPAAVGGIVFNIGNLATSDNYSENYYIVRLMDYIWMESEGVVNYNTHRIHSAGFADIPFGTVFTMADGYRIDFESATASSGWQTGSYSPAAGRWRIMISAVTEEVAASEMLADLSAVMTVTYPASVDVFAEKEARLPGLSDAISARKYNANRSASVYNNNHYAVLVHVTDVHGDAERLQDALDAAEAIGADAVINSGDTVAYYSADALPAFVPPAGIPYLAAVGNHESWKYTEAQTSEKFIAPYVAANGYVVDPSAENPTYYYRDFPSKLLRIIVVNQYQYNGKVNGHAGVEPCFYDRQMTWLAGTLLSTPSNYGIVIVIHEPEHNIVAPSGYQKFQQCACTANVISPVADMVDAFIRKTAISETYANAESGSSPASFSVAADFTQRDDTVEFIAFLSGHNHQDHIGYYEGTPSTMLCLDAVSTCSWVNKNANLTDGTEYPYYTENSDLARIPGTTNVNAFNVYVIDREKKAVKVIRIGNRVTTELVDRDRMIIPYA